MNDLELTIRLSSEYDACFEKASTLTDLRKCHCWFDRKQVISNEVRVKLTLQGIHLLYRTSKGLIQESCTYDGVLAVTEMREGIMLRLSHKRLLFLQASDNREDTELLMQAVVILGVHCKYIFKKSNLCIDKASLPGKISFRTRPRQGYYEGNAYINGTLILFVCITVFIATVFVSQPINNRIIPEPEAISLTATYLGCDPSYRRGAIRYIDLEFINHEKLTVDGCCCNSTFAEQLRSISAGTQVHLLVHPKSGNVLQVDVNGDILLAFHDAQTRIWRESVAFGVMGLFMYVIAVGFVIGMIRTKALQASGSRKSQS